MTDWHQPPSAKAYRGGLFQADTHNTDDDDGGSGPSAIPNHASILLGWGHTEADEPYWILRNSFGPEFGMKGDMLIEQGAFGVGGTIAGFEVEFA